MFYSTWFEMLWFRSVLVQTSSHRKAFAQKITSQMSVDDSHQELSCVTVLRFWTKKKSTIGSAGRERLYAGRCWSAAFRLLSPEVISAVWEQKKNQTKQKKQKKNTHVVILCLSICVDLLREKQKNRKIHHWFWQRRWAKCLSEHHRSKNDAAAWKYWSAGRETHLSVSVVHVGVFQVMLLRKLWDRWGVKRWRVQWNSPGFNSCFLFQYKTRPPMERRCYW